MLQKHLTNDDHVTTWSNVYVTWWMVFPTLSHPAKFRCHGCCRIAGMFFNFSRDHVMKRSRDLECWFLQP